MLHWSHPSLMCHYITPSWRCFSSKTKVTASMQRGRSTHQCTSAHWCPQSFLEGTGRRRSRECWCISHWRTLQETPDTRPHLAIRKHSHIFYRCSTLEAHSSDAEATFTDVPSDSGEAFSTDWICMKRASRLEREAACGQSYIQDAGDGSVYLCHIWHRGCSRLLPAWRSTRTLRWRRWCWPHSDCWRSSANRCSWWSLCHGKSKVPC